MLHANALGENNVVDGAMVHAVAELDDYDYDDGDVGGGYFVDDDLLKAGLCNVYLNAFACVAARR